MEAGDRLSHYRIVGRLGAGGMGVVYRAEDVRLGRQVALKVLAPHLAGNTLARRRFEAEARAASSLDHPNICALYDVTQLVEVADGTVLASSRYDREMEDIFAIQDDIARSAVEIVQARLGDVGTPPRVRRPTNDIEAYNLYLEGRYHWSRRSGPGLQAAVRLFEQAIEKDPRFALAYAGLADTYFQLGLSTLHTAPPRQTAARGKELCQRALALDPDLAEARTTLATFLAAYDWNWAAAETELRRVLEKVPDQTEARRALASYVFSPLGRCEEAVAEMEAALAVDPMSISLNCAMGFVLHFGRRHDQALAHLLATVEIDPDHPFAKVVLAEVLLDLGRAAEAEAILQRPSAISGASFGLAWCFARTGRREEARAALAELMEPGRPPHHASVLLIHLGELDAALDVIERALEERDPGLVWAGVRPVYDPLRDHPRFQRILDRMGLPNRRPQQRVG